MADGTDELILSPEDHAALAADTHAAQEKLAELAQQLELTRARNGQASAAIAAHLAAGVTEKTARSTASPARKSSLAAAPTGAAK